MDDPDTCIIENTIKSYNLAIIKNICAKETGKVASSENGLHRYRTFAPENNHLSAQPPCVVYVDNKN